MAGTQKWRILIAKTYLYKFYTLGNKWNRAEINLPKISLRCASLTFLDRWSMWRTTDSDTGDGFLKQKKIPSYKITFYHEENG